MVDSLRRSIVGIKCSLSRNRRISRYHSSDHKVARSIDELELSIRSTHIKFCFCTITVTGSAMYIWTKLNYLDTQNASHHGSFVAFQYCIMCAPIFSKLFHLGPAKHLINYKLSTIK